MNNIAIHQCSSWPSKVKHLAPWDSQIFLLCLLSLTSLDTMGQLRKPWRSVEPSSALVNFFGWHVGPGACIVYVSYICQDCSLDSLNCYLLSRRLIAMMARYLRNKLFHQCIFLGLGWRVNFRGLWPWLNYDCNRVTSIDTLQQYVINCVWYKLCLVI